MNYGVNIYLIIINQWLHFFLGRAGYKMVSMSSACLLHPVVLRWTSQWDFRIWAIFGSGPNTKQSHKPSVDLATDDCDTSLRSSRVGASLNPESPPQASFQPAACSPRERQTASPTYERGSQRKKQKEVGWQAEGFPWQTVSPRECSRQEPQTTTNTFEVHAQLSFSCGDAENTRRTMRATSEWGGGGVIRKDAL